LLGIILLTVRLSSSVWEPLRFTWLLFQGFYIKDFSILHVASDISRCNTNNVGELAYFITMNFINLVIVDRLVQ